MLLALTIPTIASGSRAIRAEAANLPDPTSDALVEHGSFSCVNNLFILTSALAVLTVGASAAPPTWIILVEAYGLTWQTINTAMSCDNHTPPDGCIDWAGIPYASYVYVRSYYCAGGGGGGGGGW